MSKNDSMLDFTPSDDDVRRSYVYANNNTINTLAERAGARFDRWLEAVKAQAYADGVHDGRRAEVNGL